MSSLTGKVFRIFGPRSGVPLPYPFANRPGGLEAPGARSARPAPSSLRPGKRVGEGPPRADNECILRVVALDPARTGAPLASAPFTAPIATCAAPPSPRCSRYRCRSPPRRGHLDGAIVAPPPEFEIAADAPDVLPACYSCGALRVAAPVYAAPSAPLKSAPGAPAKNPPASQPVYAPGVSQTAPPVVAQPVYLVAAQPAAQAVLVAPAAPQPAALTVRPAGPIRLAIAGFGDWLSGIGDGYARVPRPRPAPVYLNQPAPVYLNQPARRSRSI